MAVKEATTYANAPEFSLDSALNMFRPGHRKWAPDFMRQLVGGDKEKQAWAGNLTQAALYAALLTSLGYGSRKFLRGMAPETQEALEAIDKYVPSSDENPYGTDTSRLVNKSDYKSPGAKAKDALKRVFSFKNSSDDINAASYLLPPGAAIMGWMVGQKLAEKEVQATDLSDSRARLAKARADYNRVLAKKLNPKAKVPEKVIADRVQNPIDWGIDKGIEAKNRIKTNLKNMLFGKKAGDNDNYTVDLSDPEEELEKYAQQHKKHWFIAMLAAMQRHAGITKALVPMSAIAFMGSGLYAWNNERDRDKNIQKALDKKAAIKRRAQEMNDQRLDLNAILPAEKDKKLSLTPEYGGAMNFGM